MRGGLAGAQRLPQPLQIRAGGPGPVLDDLPQPGHADDAEVDHALGGRPAPGGIDLQVEQDHLPHVTGERVGAGILRPCPVQMPAQAAEQPAGRGVVNRAARFADGLRVGFAQRAGAAEPAEQDPDLGGVQRRRCLVTLLQCVEQLGAQQFGQPGQGELVHPEPGVLAGDPGRQVVTGQQALPVQPLIVEAAQTAPGDALAVTAGDPAFAGPGERACPGDERRDRLGPVLAPGTLMPEAQAGAVQVTFTAGHRAAPGLQRPGDPPQRPGVELRPGQARACPGAAAAIAAPRRAARPCRTRWGAARPRRGPR